jgi:multiple sugar transport system permease protein
MRRSKKTNRWAYAPLVLWAAIIIFPLYWVVITSLKRPVDVFAGPTYFPWLDFTPTLAAWGTIFSGEIEVVGPFLNSLVAATLSSGFAVIVGAMAAFGLARFEYRAGPWRNRDIAFWMISQRMLPPAAIVVSFFVMFNAIGLIDSVLGLTIAYLGFNIPLAVWLLRNFFSAVSREIEESALVDGATWWTAFVRITVPIAKPALASTFIFLFVFSWNEYFFASLLAFTEAQTLPIAIAGQATSIGTRWWTMSALTLVAITPTALLGLFFERFIVSGLTSGGLK